MHFLYLVILCIAGAVFLVCSLQLFKYSHKSVTWKVRLVVLLSWTVNVVCLGLLPVDIYNVGQIHHPKQPYPH